MKQKNKYIIISVTFDNKKKALVLSEMIVAEKLAACAQIIGPIKSIYRWNGMIVKSKEWLCLIKSDKKKFEKIEKFIMKNHNYQTPEIIYTAIDGGSKDYLHWISDSICR